MDLIADDIRDHLLDLSPNVPSDAEYNELIDEIVSEHSMSVVRHGRDINGEKFVQIQPIGSDK